MSSRSKSTGDTIFRFPFAFSSGSRASTLLRLKSKSHLPLLPDVSALLNLTNPSAVRASRAVLAIESVSFITNDKRLIPNSMSDNLICSKGRQNSDVSSSRVSGSRFSTSKLASPFSFIKPLKDVLLICNPSTISLPFKSCIKSNSANTSGLCSTVSLWASGIGLTTNNPLIFIATFGKVEKNVSSTSPISC